MNTKTERLTKFPQNYMQYDDNVCVLYFIGRSADYDNYMNCHTIYSSVKNGKTTVNTTKEIKDIDRCISSKRSFNTFSQDQLCVFDLIWLPDTQNKNIDDKFREGIYCEVARQMFPNEQNRYTAKQSRTENGEDISGGTEQIFYCRKEAVDKSKEILYNALYGTPMSDMTAELINDTIRKSLSDIIDMFNDDVGEPDEIRDGLSKAETRIKKNVMFRDRNIYRNKWTFSDIDSSPDKKVLYITTSVSEAIELLTVHKDKNYVICITSYFKYNRVLKELNISKKKLKDSSLFSVNDDEIYSLDDTNCLLTFLTVDFIDTIKNYHYTLFHISSNGKLTKFFMKLMHDNIRNRCKLFVSDRVTMQIETPHSSDYSETRQCFKGNIKSVIHENFNPKLGTCAGKGFLVIDIDRNSVYDTIDYYMFGIHLKVKSFDDCRLYGNREVVLSILHKMEREYPFCCKYEIKNKRELDRLGAVYMIIYNDNVQMPLGHENESPCKWFYKDTFYDRGFFNGIMNSNDRWVDRILYSEGFNWDALKYSDGKFHNPTFIYARSKEELENLSYNLHYTNIGRFLAMMSTWDNQSCIRSMYPYLADKKYEDILIDGFGVFNELYRKCDLSVKEIDNINYWNKLMYGKTAFYLRYKTGDKSIDMSEPYREVIEEKFYRYEYEKNVLF